MIFYTADIHFGDERIFKIYSRPFSDLLEYERAICKSWNDKVAKGDIVYVLGDLAQENFAEVTSILKTLNGHKHLIVGNHDETVLEPLKRAAVFESMEFIKLIDDAGRKVCVCHYPLMDWIEFNRGSYHVYGHVHNKTIRQGVVYRQIKEYFKDKLAYNAGVDVVGYAPVTLDEMIKIKEQHIHDPYIY